MRTLSYYKNLGLGDPFSWKPEDFSRFLIWDQIEAFKVEGDLEPNFLQGTKKIAQKYNKYRFFLNFYDNFFQKLWFRNSKKGKKILFHTIRYPAIILESKKYQPTGLIVEGKIDRFFAMKNFIGYLNINDLSQYVYFYLKEKNIDYLYQLVKKLEERLRILKPDYVVLWNDNFPIERAIVLVCKKLGIRTLEIQHGAFQLSLLLTSGRMVDYFLVWGQYFKDMYVRENIREPEEIYILGYPYGINKPKSREGERYTVCYLGQNVEAYRKEMIIIKLKTIDELDRVCKKLNINFVYRPHPRTKRELITKNLPQVKLTPENEKIFETIDKGDIFISFQSTSLIEAAMRSKVALQLMNYPLGSDNFEELGACTKSFQNIEQLSEYLQKIVKDSRLIKVESEFNNYYTETRYNPGQRFLEIIKEIEKLK